MPVPSHIGIIQPCLVIIDGIDPDSPSSSTSNDVDVNDNVNDMSIRTQIKRTHWQLYCGPFMSFRERRTALAFQML